MKKSLLTAGLAAVLLAGSAAPALAAPRVGPNQVAYWEDLGYGDCSKTELDDGVGSITLDPLPAGTAYTLLVLKAGSGDGAHVVIEDPEAGVAYDHGTGKDLSHVIVCTDTGVVYPPS